MTNEKLLFLNQCQKNLIDTSAKNNLINFKFSSSSCFDAEKYSQVRKNKKNKGQSFEIEKINVNKNEEELDDLEKLHKEAHKILGKMYLKQREIKDEKGFNPISWAYGFFKYKDSNKERFAPIYLIPTEIIKNGKGGYCVDHFSNRASEVSFNHAIYEKFKSDFKININKNLVDFFDPETSFYDIKQRISEIENFLTGNIHGISIERRVVIGVFNSAKAALYKEMVEMQSEFLKHNLLNIFLSKDANELNQGEISEDAREIDKLPSDRFFSPFDFDSSQLQAIKAAKNGKNFVIQGPPGTGKTQTISNIIAELVAQGKKVLFVAEKKAAIDAVLKNFSKINLGKIFLDLHDKKSKSKDIVSQIIDSINFFKCQNYTDKSSQDILSRLDDAKRKLNKRDELFHKKLSFGKRAFDLIFELNQMKEVKKIDCDFFTKLSEEDFKKCLELFEKIIDLSEIYMDEKNPFLTHNVKKLKKFIANNEEKKSVTNLLEIFEKVEDLKINQDKSSKKISKLSEKLNEANFSLKKISKVEDANNILQLFKELLLEKENLNKIDLRYKENKNIIKKIKLFFLDKKSKNIIKKLDHKITTIGFNDSLQNVISNEIKIELLESLVDEIFKNQNEFNDLESQLKKAYSDINNQYSSLSSHLKTCHIFEENNLDELKQEISLFDKYISSLSDVITYLEITKKLKELSVLDFWNHFLEKKIPPNEVIKVFKKSFYSKVWDNVIGKNELLTNTNLTSEIINDFKSLDKDSISINKKRIIDNIKNHSYKITNSIEFQQLKNRERFPKPRKVISKYRDVIVNSVGCVVCSPLTICEYFEVKKSDVSNPVFDTVIFDEASQIFTWEALSSIFRAKQMIIAGDTQQMPPTNLFASNDNDDFDEEEFEEKVNDYKGLLSFAAVRLRELQLQWHYRSKFEQLIHPSNQFVYNGSLISFPNSGKNEEPIMFHYIKEGMWEKQTNDYEAKYTIKLLKEIYAAGKRSVGVIAINKRQQTLIIDLI